MGSHSSAHIGCDQSRTNNDLEDAKSSIVEESDYFLLLPTKNIQA